ncbi:hypothetical protein Hypma_001287 [Hypsizygus marmoreus]|uniref:Uncharacterized protein n=1 Tax=Hypsizygus marmoreus TaxID=39966 RepID=A0A369K3A8_HYPMA|nr:hypothetical protein Hypma_001287 [Hypsizygus marmoreus]
MVDATLSKNLNHLLRYLRRSLSTRVRLELLVTVENGEENTDKCLRLKKVELEIPWNEPIILHDKSSSIEI